MALIIFDVDGTLFRSHLCILTAVKTTLNTLHLPPVSDETVMSLIGEKYEVFAAKIAPDYTDLDRLWRLYTQSEHDTIRHEARLFDGIYEMLGELHSKGHHLAICSNGSMEYIELALTSMGIFDFFDTVVSGGDFPSKSEAVAFISEKAPADWALMVGDRIHDFQAAKDNGMPSIGAAYGYCPESELPNCTYPAYSPDQVLAYIHQISVFSQIFKEVQADPSIRVLGVNGVDAAGKTLFTSGLIKYFISRGKKAHPIHLDDFHNPKSVRSAGENEIASYISNAFDLKRLEAELLIPLQKGERIEKSLALLDPDSDAYSLQKHFCIEADAYVILEGVLLYREPIEDYIAYKIFLDVDFDTVIRRAELRDVPKYGIDFLNKYHQKYIPIQKWYLSECAPKSKSDVVVNNRDYRAPFIID